jgi:ribosomal 30S subunit maturation factor RimM
MKKIIYSSRFTIPELPCGEQLVINLKIDKEQLNRKEVFFETKLLEKFWDEHPELEEENESWDFLIGYTLIDSDDNRIGTIANIYSVGESELASVEYQGREVLVPLHESLVVLLDEDEEILVMELPEGILEL